MIEAHEAKKKFIELLVQSGFDFNNPNSTLAWDVFKKFSHTKVNCADDALLFQCGLYNFTGENLFHFGFVRQFIFENEEEYDHMEQLNLTLYFQPHAELETLETTLWTYDCNSVEEFFQNIEMMKSFKIPSKKYTPLRCEVYQSDV